MLPAIEFGRGDNNGSFASDLGAPKIGANVTPSGNQRWAAKPSRESKRVSHNMKDLVGTSVPDNSPTTKTPAKPKPTSASLEQLVAHYNKQLPDYIGALEKVDPSLAAEATARGPLFPETTSKDEVIELIRKQNFRLKRFIRARSHELLKDVVGKNAEGRTVGRSYQEILDILAGEFPEGSTSAAALRWYVVHMWSEADDEGIARPVMPQIRPRSTKKKAPEAEVAAE